MNALLVLMVTTAVTSHTQTASAPTSLELTSAAARRATSTRITFAPVGFVFLTNCTHVPVIDDDVQ